MENFNWYFVTSLLDSKSSGTLPSWISVTHQILSLVSPRPYLKSWFENQILFTGEAIFSRNIILNFDNNHLWSEQNSHTIRGTVLSQCVGMKPWRLFKRPILYSGKIIQREISRFPWRGFANFTGRCAADTRNWNEFMHGNIPAHFSI